MSDPWEEGEDTWESDDSEIEWAPELVVSLPSDPTPGMLRSRVDKALRGIGEDEAAAAFLVETDAIRDDLPALVQAARRWVMLDVADEAVNEWSPEGPSIAGHLAALAEPVGETSRWQYAVVNVGMYDTPRRMGEVLEVAGATGWELVHVYDKASNWKIVGFEKGFMLLKRLVPPGINPRRWCIVLRN